MQYYNDNLDVIALLLNYSTSLENTLNSFLLDISSFQNTMISMERCLKYSDIIKEAASRTPKDKELSKWPYEGEIVFQKFSARYRPNTKIKLHKLSLTIKPGEKVGIVGRSGSGKSTMVLALVRAIEGCGGKIMIDNVDIRQVGLKKLRNSLNVVSQDLSLFEGSLKYNIDPLGKHKDKEIEKALEELDFSYIYKESAEGLNRKVSEGGMNFSMSERQLIYAARALLNQKHIVILDEFTSNLDYKKESLVNSILFKTFNKSTILVIAHRIKTVMKCDKVLVLHNGKVAEYGNPNELKKDRSSLFYKLYQKSYLDQLQ
jgi:ABC-type multidrug transport system fused ATPase/permease subunit